MDCNCAIWCPSAHSLNPPIIVTPAEISREQLSTRKKVRFGPLPEKHLAPYTTARLARRRQRKRTKMNNNNNDNDYKILPQQASGEKNDDNSSLASLDLDDPLTSEASSLPHPSLETSPAHSPKHSPEGSAGNSRSESSPKNALVIKPQLELKSRDHKRQREQWRREREETERGREENRRGREENERGRDENRRAREENERARTELKKIQDETKNTSEENERVLNELKKIQDENKNTSEENERARTELKKIQDENKDTSEDNARVLNELLKLHNANSRAIEERLHKERLREQDDKPSVSPQVEILAAFVLLLILFLIVKT